jgi:hypothetical protein
MRRQEMAVSNKNRIPFAGLAASRIERANIMCLVLSGLLGAADIITQVVRPAAR